MTVIKMFKDKNPFGASAKVSFTFKQDQCSGDMSGKIKPTVHVTHSLIIYLLTMYSIPAIV